MIKPGDAIELRAVMTQFLIDREWVSDPNPRAVWLPATAAYVDAERGTFVARFNQDGKHQCAEFEISHPHIDQPPLWRYA